MTLRSGKDRMKARILRTVQFGLVGLAMAVQFFVWVWSWF